LNQRKEKSGLHFFDRKSGLHILMDEIKFNIKAAAVSPRTLSIAITNSCNLKCPFCYASKSKNELSLDFLKDVAKELDNLNVFEITLGGGEPFAHQDLIEFCQWVWGNTKLGISITTNGKLLNPEKIKQLKNSISSIRLSMEAVEDKYVKNRNASFEKFKNSINLLKGEIPTSINCVVLKNNVDDLIEVIEFAIDNSINDVLIIAEHSAGVPVLKELELLRIKEIILQYQDKIQLNLTEELAKLLDINVLADGDKDEFCFAHLSSDKKIKRNSFDKNGISIDNAKNFKEAFIELIKE